jgi:hypothetical protein
MAQLKTIYDHYLFGGTSNNGEIKQVWGNDALTNAIKVWLSLYQGEVIRDPLKGGYLTKLLSKPMSEDRAALIKKDLERGLINEFTPVLKNIKVNVTPNYEKRFWNINIDAFSTDIKDSVDITLQVKNSV